ncbi:MAG TPA: rhodanese-like domain-containing protein [Vampirovibrionales bacterium]
MPEIKEINCDELKNKIEEGVLLIDVRETAEYEVERIDEAINIPLSTFNAKQVAKLLQHKKFVLHCKKGSRAIKAANNLVEEGLDVLVLAGSIEEWKKQGQSVVRPVKKVMSIFRQIQILAGTLVLLGVVLGFTVHINLFYISAFVGAGLVLAGISNTCAMASLLRLMPWNK